jgi:hypothetical protein
VIDDCYALNVSGSGAAAHFYTDFPICKISNDFRLQYWQTNLRGSHAFAVSDTQALLSGQYRDPPEIAYLADLAPGQLANVRKIKLCLPDDSPMPKGRLLGRGSYLYFFDSLSVYRLALA